MEKFSYYSTSRLSPEDLKKIAGLAREELRNYALERFEAAFKMSVVPDNVSKYPEGYVFDKNKSVRWNREQVKERNRAYEKEAELMLELHKAAVVQAEELTLLYIWLGLKDCPSREYGEKVYSFAYERGHSCGEYEIFSHIDTIVSDLNELCEIRLRSENNG